MTFTCPHCGRSFQVQVFPFHCSCGHVCLARDDPGRMSGVTPAPSVGSELTKLLALLGIRYKPACGCQAKATAMDSWGVAGCKANRGLIVAWLEEAYDHTGLGEKLAAGFMACISLPLDLLLRLSGTDLFGNILDEAIRRVELKEQAAFTLA